MSDGRRRRAGRRRQLLALLALTLVPAALLATAAPAIAVEPHETLTVKISEPAHGHVKVNGKECTEAECPFTFEKGEQVTLLAETVGEWEFAGWLAQACVEYPTAFECRFEIKEATEVFAIFLPIVPAPPVITSPTPGEVIESAGGEVTLEFDSDPSAAEIECTVDLKTPTPCSSPKTYSSLSLGEHEVEVRALNAEGQFSSSSVHFTIARPSTEEEPRPSLPPEPFFGSGGGGSKVVPRASLSARWQVRGRLTVVRKLALERLSAGDRVGARCRGGGCPFKKKELRARGSTLKLTGLFGGQPLMAGAVIQLSVDPPESAPQVIEVKVRAGAKPKIVRR